MALTRHPRVPTVFLLVLFIALVDGLEALARAIHPDAFD